MSRRKLKALWQARGAIYETLEAFGQLVPYYDGIPVLIDDNTPDTEGNETGITGTNLSSIYGIQFGMMRGLVGVTNGGLVVERIGPLETKNATRYRTKWYCSVALTRSIVAARLTGVNGS